MTDSLDATPSQERRSVAVRLREAHEAGDVERVATLTDGAPVETWFAVPPDELRGILAAIPPAVLRNRPGAYALAMLLRVAPVLRHQPHEPEPITWVRASVAAAAARLRGSPRAALRIGGDWTPRSAESIPNGVLFDQTGGWNAFVALQNGVTLMLAGELGTALARFTAARFSPPPSALSLLVRDSYVKSALVHALFGDPAMARTLLDAGAATSRTESWIEPGIDAHAQIAEALLQSAAGDAAAAERIDAVSLPDVGELWPFYVHAMRTVYDRLGRPTDGLHRIKTLEAASPARVVGDGFPGSVFETTLATDAALRGDVRGARLLLAPADPQLLTTRLAAALIDLVAGHPAPALRGAMSLRTETMGLRRLDMQRTAIVATALHRLGEIETCVEVLTRMADAPGGLSREELGLLGPELRTLGAQRVPPWTGSSDAAEHAVVSASAEPLTSRELDVLTQLAAGRTREEAAAALFVSLNTFKSHQRRLFRKLGVSSRAQAIVEAGRRGLI
ncbi:MAG: helix-turn-helix transcriptional regulator [Microbacterium sp.]